MTVGELESTMSAAEMARWEILEVIDPWGQRRSDFCFAVLRQTIMECLIKKPPSFKRTLEVFDFDCQFREQSAEELASMFDVIVAGGKGSQNG